MTKLAIIKLIQITALHYGMDPQVAVSVAAVESKFDPTVISMTGDLGVFQLNPRSFPEYSKEQLLDPKLNIKLGIRYLVEVRKYCKHREGINWLVCYNYGYKNAERVKYPHLFPYVKKVQNNLDEGVR